MLNESSSDAGSAPLAALLRRRAGRRVMIAATCVLLFGLSLGRSHLFDPDEGRHAEIARELLVTGNWITPTLQLRPYHDKPIFYYWMLAASIRLFGMEEWTLRLPSAAAACAGVIVTTWWGSRFLSPAIGGFAGLMLATTGMYVALGRFVLTDMVFSALLAGAFFYGSAWCLSGRARGRPLWPFYVLLALATLTKGPVALVLALVTFWPFVRRCGLKLRDMHLRQGVVIIAVVAGTWFVAAAVASPEYIGKFLWGHNIGRFATRRFGHPMHRLAYLYVLPAMFLPWSLYFPAAVIHARRLAHRPSLAIEFCALWFGVTFVFFSLSAAKLPTYLLPAFPPLALLTATALGRVIQRRPLDEIERRAHRGAFYGSAALACAAPVAAYVYLHHFAPQHVGMSLVALLGLPLVLIGAGCLWAGRYDLALGSVFVTTVATIVVLYAAVLPVLNEVYSLKHAAGLVRLLPPDTRVVSANAKTSSLSFYLERPVESVDRIEQVAVLLGQSAPIAVVTKTKLVAPLRENLPTAVYLWWHAPKTKALIVNRPPPAAVGITASLLTPLRRPAANRGVRQPPARGAGAMIEIPSCQPSTVGCELASNRCQAPPMSLSCGK